MLSPDDIKALAELYNSGVKISEISRRLKINPKQVYVYIKVHGIKPRKRSSKAKIGEKELEIIREMRMKGHKIHEIAEKIGVSPRTISTYLKAMGLTSRRINKCGEIDKETFIRLIKEGFRDIDIAEKMHISISCIAKYKKILGISKRVLKREEKKNLMKKTVEEIKRMIEEKGFVTSRELRTRKILLTKPLLNMLTEEIKWFKLKYTSTNKFTIFLPRLGGVIFLYKDVEKLTSYLLENMIDKNAPTKVVRYLGKINKIPSEVVETLINRLGQIRVRTPRVLLV